MTRLDSLPADQRAVLSLVLKKGRAYGEIATLLKIDEDAVRERDHAAIDGLGPRDGTPPPARRRGEIADFLLGQSSAEDAAAIRGYLESSASGRAWARVLAGELRGMTDADLPDIPSERPSAPASGARRSTVRAASPAGASAAATEQRAVTTAPITSRRGGAILLAGAAAVVIVVVIVLLATSGGGSSHKARPQTATTSGASTTSTTAQQAKILAQINLVPQHGRSPLGVATLIQQGTTEGLALQVTGLAPTSAHLAYGVWLYNSHASSERVGFAPPVKTDGKLAAIAPVPKNLANYRSIIITRETTAARSTPGPIVLSGPLPGHTLFKH